MSSVLVDVSEAVAAALNEGTFSVEFEAIRSYADWDDELDDEVSDQLLCDVVGVSILESETETRGSILYMPEVDILLRQRLGPDQRLSDGRFRIDELDQLRQVVEEVHQFFVLDRLTGHLAAAYDANKGARILASGRRTHLRQHHQFTGHIRVPFQVSVEAQ